MIRTIGTDQFWVELEKVKTACGGNAGAHPDHPRSDWIYEVNNHDTCLDYWAWVVHQLESEEQNGRSN